MTLRKIVERLTTRKIGSSGTFVILPRSGRQAVFRGDLTSESFNALSIAEMKRILVTLGALCLILAGCSNYVQASAPKAAFIGDSITAGHGASSEQTRWTSLVSQRMGWIEHNFGRGGTGYLATSSREGCGLDFCPNYLGMLNDVVSSDPDIVVVAGGGERHGGVREQQRPGFPRDH